MGLVATLVLILFVPVSAQGTGDGQTNALAGDSSVPLGQTPGLDEYMKATANEIATINATDSRLTNSKIQFGCNLVLAHGANIGHEPLDVLLAAADALKAAGAERIDINPVVTVKPEPAVAKKYLALIAHIHQLGVKLELNPESEPPARTGIDSFATFQDTALKDYADWAARYKPDNFVLIHEPTTMSARLHIQTTPDQWVSFIQAAAKVVKAASPNTLVGAGCFTGLSDRETPFFDAFVKLPELDFVTFDNYVGTPRAVACMDHFNQLAHAANKPIYMEETWRPHFLEKGAKHEQGASMESISAVGFGYAGFQDLDAQWLNAMAHYAATHGMQDMNAFQTTCFFAYTDLDPTDGPGFDNKVNAAVLANQHTPTYTAFQTLARRYGGE